MKKASHICITPNTSIFIAKDIIVINLCRHCLLCYSNFPQISIFLTKRKRFRGRVDADILRRTDVRIKYKSRVSLIVKEIDNERRRNLCDAHVRDKENRTRIFSLVESPSRSGEKNSVHATGIRGNDNAVRCHEKGLSSKDNGLWHRSVCVTRCKPHIALTLIIIASSTLLKVREENIMSVFVAITTIIPSRSSRLPAVVSRVTKTERNQCSVRFFRDR